jgi:hypothetical protein
MGETVYIVERDSKGNVAMLYRFRHDEEGIPWREYLSQNVGQWVNDNTLLSVLNNLHDPRYEEVSEERAAEFASIFGG